MIGDHIHCAVVPVCHAQEFQDGHADATKELLAGVMAFAQDFMNDPEGPFQVLDDNAEAVVGGKRKASSSLCHSGMPKKR